MLSRFFHNVFLIETYVFIWFFWQEACCFFVVWSSWFGFECPNFLQNEEQPLGSERVFHGFFVWAKREYFKWFPPTRVYKQALWLSPFFEQRQMTDHWIQLSFHCQRLCSGLVSSSESLIWASESKSFVFLQWLYTGLAWCKLMLFMQYGSWAPQSSTADQSKLTAR